MSQLKTEVALRMKTKPLNLHFRYYLPLEQDVALH